MLQQWRNLGEVVALPPVPFLAPPLAPLPPPTPIPPLAHAPFLGPVLPRAPNPLPPPLPLPLEAATLPGRGAEGTTNFLDQSAEGTVGLSTMADALVQGSIVGCADELPERYMQAIIAGTTGSGIYLLNY